MLSRSSHIDRAALVSVLDCFKKFVRKSYFAAPNKSLFDKTYALLNYELSDHIIYCFVIDIFVNQHNTVKSNCHLKRFYKISIHGKILELEFSLSKIFRILQYVFLLCTKSLFVYFLRAGCMNDSLVRLCWTWVS